MKEQRRSKHERYRSYSTDKWEVIDDLNQWNIDKEPNDSQEQIKQEYNIAVYRILPFPPGTKNVKDFFIHID